MRAFRHVVASWVLGLIIVNPVMAGVLLGSADYVGSGDLTRIQVGSNTLEFLDLTLTVGVSVADASTLYASDGFRWASKTEMTELLSSFNMTYSTATSAAQNNQSGLGGSASDHDSFVSYLGNTLLSSFGSASIGWLDDLSSATHHTYACIGSSCDNVFLGAFTNSTTDFWPVEDPQVTLQDPTIAVFLVRDAATVVVDPPLAVPVPPTLALVGIGFAALGCNRRKRAGQLQPGNE